MSSAEATAAPVADVAPGGVWASQLGSELRLVFGRRRNLAMLLLTAIPVFIAVAVKMSTPQPGEGPPLIIELTGHGLFLAFTALAICLPVFLPLAVAVVAGDAVAGEAGAGTLRYLLSIPVSRGRLLAVKTLGVLAYLAAAILRATVGGLVTGVILLGTHGVTLISGDTVSVGDGVVRAAAVAALVFVDWWARGDRAVPLDTHGGPGGRHGRDGGQRDRQCGAGLRPPAGWIRSALLTHHWLDFAELLRSTPDVSALLRWSLVPLAYPAIFGTAAGPRITTADVSG